jgi:outer membrane protein OmpA-like peptidoglycan-associated protein
MKFTFISSLFLLFSFKNPLICQNLVRNASFEKAVPLPIPTKPSAFFRTMGGSQFVDKSAGFLTVYNSTPDFITSDNKFMLFADFKDYLVSDFKAKSGKMAIGIRILGCKTSDICCREVIQIPFEKPMQAKKKYHIELWAARMIGAPAIPLSIFFSDSALIENPMANGHHVKPQILTDTVVGLRPFQWVRIADTIEASSNFRFMSIGNFIVGDDNTPQVIVEKEMDIPRSYYFFDDILVRPLEGYIPPVAEVIVEKPAIVLSDINFNTAESKLLPYAFTTLDSLAQKLMKQPDAHIEIVGHTDNRGTTPMNQQLSERRAQAVQEYLLKRGVTQNQITTKGKGETKPISDNTTDNGRKINRRVEIFVKIGATRIDRFD